MAKSRKECFFGLHFDFHANDDSHHIGKRTTRDQIQAVINIVHPDFLQCDSKGHRGLSSYPTETGHPAPSIDKDMLRIWRDVTNRNGVALYAHYSGIWDMEALACNPEWAAIQADGSRHKYATSVFSDYTNRIVIPQLCELAGKYGLDGVWVDGDCWGMVRDYGEKAIRAFQTETGITEIPKDKDHKYFQEFNEFCRRSFKSYIQYYTDTLHQKYPSFQLTSNWAFTTYMPEPVSVDLDYLSGDVWGVDCFNTARFEARYMAQQGRPWDLMCWNMAVVPNKETDSLEETDYSADKPAVQLMQEASVILAQGGGFQLYYTQERDGAIDLEKIQTAAEVAGFCRARQPYCFGANSIAETAILYSGYSIYRKGTNVYSFGSDDLNGIQGVLQCMLNAQMPVDVVSEFHLKDRYDKYSVIVIPEWQELNNIPELLEYVENGGNLIVVGAQCAQLFEEPLGIKVEGITRNTKIWLSVNHLLTSFGKRMDVAKVTPTGATVTDRLYHRHSRDGNAGIAATVNTYGKGRIAGIYFDLGRGYLNGKTSGACDFIRQVVERVHPEMKVRVTGSRNVEVTVSRLGDKTIIGLINTAGPHGDRSVFTYDEIPATGPVLITLKHCTQPAIVRLQPENKTLPFSYTNGTLQILVDSVGIYSILEIA